MRRSSLPGFAESSADDRAALGRAGESIAARFLAGRGARLLARNLAVGGGEIDLLVEVGRERAVVEVRTVRGEEPAVAAFGAAKSAQVRRLARRLRPPVYRVDLVAVRLGPSGFEVHWVQRVD